MVEQFSNEFLQGFIEEANEHLRNIHQNLLGLEQSLSASENPVEALLSRVGFVNELFRSFHTIKGLSGMVGLQPAADLSHAMEAVLQAVKNGRLEVSLHIIDRLINSTRLLEAVIATVSNPAAAMPEISSEIQALERLQRHQAEQEETIRKAAEASDELNVSGNPISLFPDLVGYPELIDNLSASDVQRLLLSIQRKDRFTLITFLPSDERSAAGQNVDWLRRQIQSSGEIIKAVPLVRGASIRFAFLVSSVGALQVEETPGVEIFPLEVAQPTESGFDHAQVTPVAAPEEPPAFSLTKSTTVRVDLARLDDVMREVGSLVLLQSRLREMLSNPANVAASIRREVDQTYHLMDRSLRELRHSVLRIRMVPLQEAFNQMSLVVRDITRTTGKEVRLVLQGAETEVDKYLVDRLLDPLIHLVRNAIVHGIESPEERMAAGKPRQGTIVLAGKPVGDHIIVTVTDDGRGVDIKQIAQKAVSIGLLDSGTELTAVEALDLISRPGFSTREEADLGSGRGVGLDIVQKTVQEFRGLLSMETEPGKGSSFCIRLPLTMIVIEAMIVRIGNERYAVPQDSIAEVVEIKSGDVVTIESGEIIRYRENSIALLRLARLVGLPEVAQPSPTPFEYGLVHNDSERQWALVVDRVIGLREVVVHTISDPYIARPGIAGATELGDGQVILILDLPALFRLAKGRSII